MRKVLIIMERECLRDALQQELQQAFEVIACGNADDGAVLLQDQPDAMVLDLFLPGTDGLTFLRQNRECLPPAVVALSVLTTPEILEALAVLGVTAVIRKPCTVKAILSAIKICV
nr:response regulator transcription factor [Oscillospiraceae bacterium]